MRDIVTKKMFFGIFLLLGITSLQAQNLIDKYAEIYPKREFTIQQIKDQGYQKVVVWQSEYTKGPDDESGMTWSNMEKNFQAQKHVFPDGQFKWSTYYREDMSKEKMYKYYYKGKQIAAIDELEFDSLQDESVRFTYKYAYRGEVPVEKVQLYPKDPNFRVMYAYSFDTTGRMLRKQITGHGQIKRFNSLLDLEEDPHLVLISYTDKATTYRTYRNRHDIIESRRTQFNEDGQLLNTRVKGPEHQVLKDIGYTYSNGQLTKEVHSVLNDEGVLTEDTIIYYLYNDRGLIDQKIIEQGKKQLIFSYQYSEEY